SSTHVTGRRDAPHSYVIDLKGLCSSPRRTGSMSELASPRPWKHAPMRRRPALGTVMVLLPVLASPAGSAASADDLRDLTAFRGQLVYGDFWASSSASCRRRRALPSAASGRGACRLVAGRLGRVQSRAYQKGSQDK